jgi:hypothetical protein
VAISAVVITTSSPSVLPGIATAPWTMPTRYVASGTTDASSPSSGLFGAFFVGNTEPNTTTSQADRWTHGRAGVRTVTKSSSGSLPAIASRSYAR